MHTINLNAIKAMGRSDIFIRLEIIKKVNGVILFILLMRYGIFALAWAQVIQSMINQAVNAFPNRKLLGYRYLEQLTDILPNIILAIVMGAVTYALQFISVPLVLKLLIQVSVGAGIYIVGSYILKFKAFLFTKEMVMGFLKQEMGE